MKQWKWILSLLTAIVLVFAVAACTPGSGSEGGTGGSGNQMQRPNDFEDDDDLFHGDDDDGKQDVIEAPEDTGTLIDHYFEFENATVVGVSQNKDHVCPGQSYVFNGALGGGITLKGMDRLSKMSFTFTSDKNVRAPMQIRFSKTQYEGTLERAFYITVNGKEGAVDMSAPIPAEYDEPISGNLNFKMVTVETTVVLFEGENKIEFTQQNPGGANPDYINIRTSAAITGYTPAEWVNDASAVKVTKAPTSKDTGMISVTCSTCQTTASGSIPVLSSSVYKTADADMVRTYTLNVAGFDIPVATAHQLTLDGATFEGGGTTQYVAEGDEPTLNYTAPDGQALLYWYNAADEQEIYYAPFVMPGKALTLKPKFGDPADVGGAKDDDGVLVDHYFEFEEAEYTGNSQNQTHFCPGIGYQFSPDFSGHVSLNGVDIAAHITFTVTSDKNVRVPFEIRFSRGQFKGETKLSDVFIITVNGRSSAVDMTAAVPDEYDTPSGVNAASFQMVTVQTHLILEEGTNTIVFTQTKTGSNPDYINIKTSATLGFTPNTLDEDIITVDPIPTEADTGTIKFVCSNPVHPGTTRSGTLPALGDEIYTKNETATERTYSIKIGSSDYVVLRQYKLTLDGATFEDGSTEQYVTAGTQPQLKFTAPQGQVFSHWYNADDEEETFEAPFTMPAKALTLKPAYTGGTVGEDTGTLTDHYFQFENATPSGTMASQGKDHFCANQSFYGGTAAGGDIILKAIDKGTSFTFTFTSDKSVRVPLEIRFSCANKNTGTLANAFTITVNGQEGMVDMAAAIPTEYFDANPGNTNFYMVKVETTLTLTAGVNVITFKQVQGGANPDYINIRTSATLSGFTPYIWVKDTYNVKTVPTESATGEVELPCMKCSNKGVVVLPVLTSPLYKVEEIAGGKQYTITLAGVDVTFSVIEESESSLDHYFQFENATPSGVMNSQGKDHFCVNQSFYGGTATGGEIILKAIDKGTSFSFTFTIDKAVENVPLEIRFSRANNNTGTLGNAFKITVNGEEDKVDMTAAIPTDYFDANPGNTNFYMVKVVTTISLAQGENTITFTQLKGGANPDYINIQTDAKISGFTPYIWVKDTYNVKKTPTESATGEVELTCKNCSNKAVVVLPVLTSPLYTVKDSADGKQYCLTLAGVEVIAATVPNA